MGAGHERGRKGEDLAAAYLEAQGWRILDRNWRSGHAEIDLVVLRRDVVAFVEVKTRASERCGDPLESITPRKRREIERIARAWLHTRGREVVRWREVRFDAVAVTLAGRSPPVLRHVPDAWRGGDSG